MLWRNKLECFQPGLIITGEANSGTPKGARPANSQILCEAKNVAPGKRASIICFSSVSANLISKIP
jgi:hypothetical protein